MLKLFLLSPVIVGFAAPSLALAAGTLTLEDATRGALSQDKESSFVVQRANSQVRYQAAKQRESFSYFLPTLEVNGSHLFARKYVLTDIAFGTSPTPISIPQILSDTQFNAVAQWWLFDGLRNFDRYAGASLVSRSTQDDRDWARFRTEREIRIAFFQTVAQRDLIKVAEQTRDALKVHRDDAQRFLNVGTGTRYDLLRVESQLGQAEVDVLSAQDQEQTYRSRFYELIGREDGGEQLTGELPAIGSEVVGMISGASRSDFGSRSDLQALDERTRGLQKLAHAASLYLVPRIGVFYQGTEYNNLTTGLDRGDFRFAYQFGVNFTWNLFDGFYSASRSTQAAEERVQAQVALDQGRLQAVQDELIWKRKFITSAKLVDARSIEVAKAEEAARIARTGRRAGTITNTQLLDAEVERFRATAGLVNARVSEIESLNRYELATGRTFETAATKSISP